MIIDISQQENAKLRIGNLIKIFKSFSKKVGRWKDDWIAFSGQHENKISGYKSTWELFRLATSSIADYTENISNIIEKLETIKGSIPDPDKSQRLKVKINAARTEIESLDQEIKSLEQKKNELGKKISTGHEKSSKSLRSCIGAQTTMDDLLGRQSSVGVSIDEKRTTLQRKIDRFHRKKETLYEKSKAEEIKRCEELKGYAAKLLGAFDLTSENFDKVANKYDAATDFDQWERKNKQLERSQSTKDKTIREEDQ